MTEANEHGLRTVVVVYEDDPLANVESKNLLWKGGPLLAAGMAGWAQNHLMMRSNEHED